MALPNQSPFSRKAYSPYNAMWLDGVGGADREGEPVNLNEPKQTFTGADLQAYLNNKRVSNLESVTWSISVEVVGNYVMGRRDAVTYTTGKRVIAGSIVFSQYDKHAFLHEVWQLHRMRGRYATVGDLWGYDVNTTTAQSTSANYQTPLSIASISGGARVGYGAQSISRAEQAPAGAAFGFGLSQQAFDEQLRQQLMQTARIVGSQKFMYSDQIPPFDLTLVAVNNQGYAARAAVLGMRITQETTGFSQNDLSNAVGMSYVALSVDPWSPVENLAGIAYIPPVA